MLLVENVCHGCNVSHKTFVCMSLFRRRSLPLRKENMVFMRRNDLIPYGSKPNLIKECIPVRYVLPAAVAAIRCTGGLCRVGEFSAWGGSLSGRISVWWVSVHERSLFGRGGVSVTETCTPPIPTVDRMTHNCEIITLPQTSFAGGKINGKFKLTSIWIHQCVLQPELGKVV